MLRSLSITLGELFDDAVSGGAGRAHLDFNGRGEEKKGKSNQGTG